MKSALEVLREIRSRAAQQTVSGSEITRQDAGQTDLLRVLEIPICEVRCLYRRRDEIEVLEVQPISPPGQTRWEWRSVRGKYVAELKDCTTDQALARGWVAALRAADSGDVADG